MRSGRIYSSGRLCLRTSVICSFNLAVKPWVISRMFLGSHDLQFSRLRPHRRMLLLPHNLPLFRFIVFVYLVLGVFSFMYIGCDVCIWCSFVGEF
ncbi:unnamed protein product [Gongylonema pulchrum]|uniref:Ovule protein n=1 Tax=Gongylonema pulchrum TaxID=637853 RepID=A0A183EHC9_9BILA|nr:unnamed protein product [Gongylonema pulchrum]